jgi:hypothetical protein
MLETATSKVNDFDAGLVDFAKKDIFRFKVTMNDGVL